MDAVQGLETLWQSFRRLENEGSFNRFIIQALRHFRHPEFTFIAREVAEAIARRIHSHGHLIAPENVESLANLPARLRHRSGLDIALAGYRPQPAQPVVGRIAFAAVTESDGYVRNLVTSSGRFSEMPKARRVQLDRVGAATVAALGRRLGLPVVWHPQRYSFWVFDPMGREDDRVDGNSMDLPLAIALYSHLTQAPVPTEVSASAEICRDGSLRRVCSIDKKIEALKYEHPKLVRVLVAGGQDDIRNEWACRSKQVDDLYDALELVFPDEPNAEALGEILDVASVADAIQSQYDANLKDACLMNAEALIAYLRGAGRGEPEFKRIPALFTALWRRGSCLSHRGDVDGAMASLSDAVKTYNRFPHLIREESCAECRNSYGVALRDVFRYLAAETLHLQNEADLERIGTLGHIRAKNLSSLSQLYLAWSRFEEAAETQKNALAMIHEDQRERNYGILAQIYTRWGRFAQAEAALVEQKVLLDKYNKKPANFRRWIQAEFFYRHGLAERTDRRAKLFSDLHAIASEVAPEGAAVEDFPAALVLKFSGLARLADGEAEKGLALLQRCITFFETVTEPMFPLIGAGVRAQRALYLIESGRAEKAGADVVRVAEVLTGRWFANYFGSQVSVLRRLKEPVEGEADLILAVADALRFVRDAIPY